MKKKATKWNNISNIGLNFRVCFVDIADSIARAPKRAKQLSMATILSSFGVVLVSCRVNFHVVRSASQYSACRIYMCLHILVINVLINWQLSKQVTCWPVSLDRIAGSGVDPSGSSIFFLKFSADKLLVFKWSKAQVQLFLKFTWNMLCLCDAQLKFWFQTDLGSENSASCYRQGKQLLLTFLTMVTRWSRSTSNFYALIGQNLTGEFMRKIYAAFWKLFTLTAEVDRVLCQLVMFLTVFLHWK